jgi:hypothetical protein
MSTVVEQPRDDVPIVTDATLLAVPNMQDPEARTEYLKRVRALRNTPDAAAPQAQTTAPIQNLDAADLPAELLTDADDATVESSSPDAIPDVTNGRRRLSADDLQQYEIPVVGEDGTVEYLSYEDFNKTVGTYAKVNKKARELADREREIDAIKTRLVEANQAVLQSTESEEAKIAKRYEWVQNSIAHAHRYSVDTVKFQDGTHKSVSQLIAEKTALENQYAQQQQRKSAAEQQIRQAQEDFIQAQEEVLKQRSPSTLKARNDIAKFLERSGFSADDANALSHSKAELMIVLDKAMRYDNALKSQSKEKRVGQNTRVLAQRSRSEGRGVSVGNPQSTRIQELERLGTKANREQLKELYRLKQGR